MNILKMNKYGSVLSGREYGKDTMTRLSADYPVVVDFEGVVTLGSSFADEVLKPIAQKQGNRLTIRKASAPILACINDLAIDAGIEIDVVA